MPETLPVYAKIAFLLLAIVAFFFIAYIGQDIIVPLAFALLFSILLNPLVNMMTNRGMGRVLAIFIVVSIGVLLVGVVVYFLGRQVSRLSDNVPIIRRQMLILMQEILAWITRTFNVSYSNVNAWVQRNLNGDKTGAFIGNTIAMVTGVLVAAVLIPVYVFMILFYKPLLLQFVAKLFERETHGTVVDVLTETKALVQNYLRGLMIEAVIMAVLNSVGLLVIGVPYALLWGVIGALLNMIPWVGGIVATALPMLMALTTGSPTKALWVMAWYGIVQFVDNHYIVPKIVASRVQLNALVSLVVVFIGGALWGISGMFLSIPLTALVKVICDRIEPLKPWGFLLGDTMPPIGKTFFSINRFRRKPKAVVEANT